MPHCSLSTRLSLKFGDTAAILILTRVVLTSTVVADCSDPDENASVDQNKNLSEPKTPGETNIGAATLIAGEIIQQVALLTQQGHTTRTKILRVARSSAGICSSGGPRLFFQRRVLVMRAIHENSIHAPAESSFLRSLEKTLPRN